MNVVIDTLYLRKPRIEYVSPPICEAQFSSSGGPVIILPDIARLRGPTGGRVGGRGHRFFSFNNVPGQICFQIYVAVDPTNPNSPYNLISDCIPNGSIALCSEGYYEISAINGRGQESPRSSPIAVSGGGYTIVMLPLFPHTVAYNLYKSSNGPAGPYSLYWYAFSGSSFEVCTPGCYRITAVTGDGETPPSDPTCTDFSCDTLTCPTGTGWNSLLCECIPCDLLPHPPCEPGFIWQGCSCIPDGGGGGDVTLLFGCLGDVFGDTTLAPGSFVAPCDFQFTGDLPPGITSEQDSPISANVSGTPTVGGLYRYHWTITDSLGKIAIFYYDLTTFGFTNGNPPNGATGTAYDFQFTGDGGTTPYVFSVISGSLPTGLNMDAAGHVTGTPSVAATNHFEIQIADATTPDQNICTRNYTVTIADNFCSGVPTNISDLVWTFAPGGPGNSMTGGSGTMHLDLSGAFCTQWTLTQGCTSRICNPTDADITLTWTCPWTDGGFVCASGPGNPNTIIFFMELYDVTPGSGTSNQTSRDLIVGPFTPVVLTLTLPAHSVKYIHLSWIVGVWVDTVNTATVDTDGNMTLT